MPFSAPPCSTGRLVATLPDALRDAGSDNGWNLNQPAGPAASSFIEGPSFDESGNLWFVGLLNGRLLTLRADGVIHVDLQYDGWPKGLKFHRDGRIFIADHKNGIMVLTARRRRSRWRSSDTERSGSRRSMTCSSHRTVIFISPTRD